MDTLNTLLIGWIIFSLFVIFLGTFFYDQVVRGTIFQTTVTQENESKSVLSDDGGTVSDSGGSNSAGEPIVLETPPAAVPTIVPQEVPESVAAPLAAGADPDAVVWVNSVLSSLFNAERPQGSIFIRDAWATGLNDYTVTSALDTGVLVEILEVLPATPAPQLTNVVVDCPPGTDDMTITCDCMMVVYFRILCTRTQGPVTTESEYACAVDNLAGRLHIDVHTDDHQGTIKFVGWPQVTLALEGLRNNSSGLDELTLQDVISELLTVALRNVILSLNFTQIPNFPPFVRARHAPDRIVPVGYDAMVREVQSHPAPKVTPRTKKQLINGDVANAAALGFNNNLSERSELTLSEEELIYNLRNGKVETEIEQINNSGIPNNYKEENVTVSHVETSLPTVPAPVKRESHSVYTEVGVGNNDVLIPVSVPVPATVKREPQPVYTELSFVDMEPPPQEGYFKPAPMIQEIPFQVEDDHEMFSEEQGNELIEEFLEDDIAEVEIEQDLIENITRRSASPIRPILKVKEPKIEAKLEPKIELSPEIDEEEDEMPLQIKLLGNVAAQQQSVVVGNGSTTGIPGLNGKRLLVKIVKAASVGCDQDVTEAYAVVEMDEPAQRFNTTVVKDTNSPFWDEQFLFDLSEGTLELLFELYDKSTNQFLGLAIVGIEELVATPSQRQIIPLQPRPYEDDHVSGSLTVEFLFLDRADIPELALRTSDTSQRVSPRGDKITTTTTTYLISPETPDLMVNGCSDSVVSAALRDIEEKNIPVSNNANKSTMIIHASRKPEEEQLIADTDVNNIPSSATNVPSEAGQASDSSALQSDAIPSEERGRSRGRSGKRDSFFGTLKKRFSRSRLRSKSMDPDTISPGSRDASVSRTNGHHTPDNVPRSISMERQSHRASGGDGGSTRSSLSDHSAISSSSTRTYVNENSTLIVEAVENGVTKHYLIPLSLQQRSKWRKKGTKLHVFNEHSFVAKHLSSSTPCQVCQKTLSRRLGKQGYECRDCGFKCHKPCHVKTDTVCPNSTVNSMDLEIIKDTREERRSWMKKNKNS